MAMTSDVSFNPMIASAGDMGRVGCCDFIKRVRAHILIHLLKPGKMRFEKVQDAMRDGYEVSERGWREGS